MKLLIVVSISHVHSALRCTDTRVCSACIIGNAIQRSAKAYQHNKKSHMAVNNHVMTDIFSLITQGIERSRDPKNLLVATDSTAFNHSY
uniref:Putative secreted protein n=1 Tax=Anopheles darlingi TaxID=43151 RepID=A0A2M4DIU3_ANODA